MLGLGKAVVGLADVPQTARNKGLSPRCGRKRPIEAQRVLSALPAPSPAGFDWCADNSIVAREQPATAVYRNQDDAVVVRQARCLGDAADSFVVIQRNNAQAIADAILKAAGITTTTAPRDPTAAKRQRQRRARVRDVAVSDRDGHAVTDRDAPPLVPA